MYEGLYNHTQAAVKCTEEGGVIALAADRVTFTFMYQMMDTYYLQGGPLGGAFIDGKKQTEFGEWFCSSTDDLCPFRPHQPDTPQSPQCAVILLNYAGDVGVNYCGNKRMAMCEF